MLDAGISPDEFTFNNLLTGAGRGCRGLPEISWVLDEMRARDVALNVYLGTSLIHAYRNVPFSDEEMRHSCLQRSAAVVEALKAGGRVGVYPYTALMQLYADVGNVRGVLRAFHEMEALGIAASEVCLKVVISACHETGASHLAGPFEERLERMEGGRRGGMA